jgi:lipid II isoglutaminyl synthase (glutamine-hydrolysing)
MRLEVETTLARAAGRLSRAAGRGGGTTLPGKLLAAVDPGAVAALADRLDAGSIVISATNGKTTTAAMAAEILTPRFRLAHNAAGANLVSGVASALIGARDAELGLFEVDEAALPSVVRSVRPRVVALGNLFRDQLDRYGELELVAERWRDAIHGLQADTWLVVNGDDPLVGDLGTGRPRAVTFGVDDPALTADGLQHAADSKYCVRCGAAYDYPAVYVGHLGEYACPKCGHRRPPLDVAARAVDLDGIESVSFDLHAGDEARRVRLEVPGLYNVYNALAAAAATHAVGVPIDAIAAGLARARPAFGRFERIAMDGKTLLVLLIKNPAGANESVRTLLRGEGPALAVLALNDAIADGRDVSWIWDVDFEPLAARLGRVIVSGERAAELGLRFAYGGMSESAIEVVPDLGDALDRGLEHTPAGGELAFLPTYTAMLGLQRLVAERGHAKPYWERVA